jgi:hypothetical protein
MLAVAYRSKLPKTLSFPIGAQELSAALSGVPQYECMKINFYGKPTDCASDFADMLRRRCAYSIVSAAYSHVRLGLSESKEMAQRGMYDERWEILVYPVERENRHSALQCLRSGGLQQIRQWLLMRRPDTWRAGRHSFELVFDPQKETIYFREDTA